jgi:hypothetical protein
MMDFDDARISKLFFVVALSLFGCHAKKAAVSGPDAGPTSATSAVTSATGTGGAAASAEAPPADVPTFLDRFCKAVAAGDRAYVLAHTDNGTFSSAQGTDPDSPRPGRRTHHVGGAHADFDFTPVCARVRAQPAADLPKRIREEDGLTLVRLKNDALASDLVIERRGTDFRLLREDEPHTAKAPRGGGGAHH